MLSRSLAATLLVAGALAAACDKSAPVTPTAPAAPVAPVAPAPLPPVPPAPQGTVRGSVLSLEGIPLDGMQVRTEFGSTTATDRSGSFALPYPMKSGLSYSYVVAGNNNYEIARSPFNREAEQAQLQPIRLQPRLDFTEGSLQLNLSKVDLSYFTGEPYESDFCSPCKRVRLHSDKPRKVLVTLEWSGSAPLQLWIWVGSPAEPEIPHMETGYVIGGKAQQGDTHVTLEVMTQIGDTVVHVGVPYDRTATAPLPTVPFTLSVRPG